MKKLFTLLVALVIISSGSAQSPEKMSYQAIVRNNGNVLVTNQAVGMKISILQGTATGTSVYVETQTPTTNVNGLATIEIGDGTVVTGTFATIDWENGPYFITIETDPTGGTNYTITGTSQLLSVPYALYSKAAETVDFNGLTNKPTTLSGYGITGAGGVNWLESTSAIAIPEVSGELSSITINAPQLGYVIVTASGYVNWLINSTDEGTIRLTVSTTSGNIDAPVEVIGIVGVGTTAYYRYPFSISRVFAVSSGTTTFYFNGYLEKIVGHAWVHNHTLIGLFVPARY